MGAPGHGRAPCRCCHCHVCAGAGEPRPRHGDRKQAGGAASRCAGRSTPGRSRSWSARLFSLGRPIPSANTMQMPSRCAARSPTNIEQQIGEKPWAMMSGRLTRISMRPMSQWVESRHSGDGLIRRSSADPLTSNQPLRLSDAPEVASEGTPAEMIQIVSKVRQPPSPPKSRVIRAASARPDARFLLRRSLCEQRIS